MSSRDFAAPRPRHARTVGNLPETVTSFIGRSREVAEIRQGMSESRLLTLTGAGGVGKTRLALYVAAAARRTFADGVWLVDLSSLAVGDRVAQPMLSALEVRDQSTRPVEAQLVEHLRDRHLLIVLDNCEHVLDAIAPLTSALLREAPALHLVATSREPLGLDGERVISIPPLATPDPAAAASATEIARYEAVALLIDRARSVRPDFKVGRSNQLDVAQLVARLDGVPLAIELAAVRLRSLSIAEVVARLDDRFRLLDQGSRGAPPRQQTLRALIDWSFDLCTSEEQLAWRRLAVFAGSFDLRAAEGVCAGDGLRPEVMFDLIDHLVAKSILLADRVEDRVRYRMLSTVRAYGTDLLAANDDAGALRLRHAEYYRARARTTVEQFCGPGQAEMIATMRDDRPNLRTALTWSGEAPERFRLGAALAADLRYLWIAGGALSEGSRWLDEMLERTPPSRERGNALWVAAWIMHLQGDHVGAGERARECAALAASLGDDGLQAHAMQHIGLIGLFSGDSELSIGALQEAAAGHRRCGHSIGGLLTAMQLAVALAYADRLAEAQRVCEDALARSDEAGERWTHGFLDWAAGIVAWRGGDLDGAAGRARRALGFHGEFHDGLCSGLSIELLAIIAAAEGSFVRTARLSGAARSIWAELGTSITAFGAVLSIDSARAADEARAAVGGPAFADLVLEGGRLGTDHAVAAALDDSWTRAAPPPTPSPLSPRERQVAAMISDGASNREIAAALILSPRTIDGHVERIFAKLGMRARAQVAAWFVQQGEQDR